MPLGFTAGSLGTLGSQARSLAAAKKTINFVAVQRKLPGIS